MDASNVRLWKWLTDDVLAIVTKTVGAFKSRAQFEVVVPSLALGLL